MVATDRITADVQIRQSFSASGAIVHLRVVHCSLGPRKSAPNGTSIGSAVFAGLTVVPNGHTHRHADHGTTSVAVGCTVLVHEIRLKSRRVDRTAHNTIQYNEKF